MARKKQYIEEEVIEKAMNLFWRNGYEATSMSMLEKEMGINKFSIYASFGSKNGVFLESITCYKKKLSQLTNKLRSADDGIVGLKQYFYDFIDFTKETEFGKGCLITNTANQIGVDADEKIKEVLLKFTEEVKQVFSQSLKQDKLKDQNTIEQQSDFLIISMFALASATRMFNKMQLNNYIENIFKKI
jgi:AcrR family transcriptional regulator